MPEAEGGLSELVSFVSSSSGLSLRANAQNVFTHTLGPLRTAMVGTSGGDHDALSDRVSSNTPEKFISELLPISCRPAVVVEFHSSADIQKHREALHSIQSSYAPHVDEAMSINPFNRKQDVEGGGLS